MDEWLDRVESCVSRGDRAGWLAAIEQMRNAITQGGAEAAAAAHRALQARGDSLREALAPAFNGVIGQAFLGDDRLDAAEPYLEQYVARASKLEPPDALVHADAVELLGQLFGRQLRYAYAAECARRCLALRTAALSADDPYVALPHVQLGALYRECGQWQVAADHFRRALEPLRLAGDAWAMHYHFTLVGFVETGIKSGFSDRLESVLEGMVSRLAPGPEADRPAFASLVALALIKRIRGNLEASQALAARAQDACRQRKDDEASRSVFIDLADLQAGFGRSNDAVESLSWVADLDRGRAQRLLDTVHLAQRITYSDRLAAATDEVLKLALDKLAGDDAAARMALEMVLSRKGLLTEAELKHNNRAKHLAGHRLDAQVEHIDKLHTDLRNTRLEGPTDGHRKQFFAEQKLEREIREAEGQLAACLDSTFYNAASAIELADVAATLAPDEALIEYVALRIPDDNPMDSLEPNLMREVRSERYAAFVLTHEGHAHLVDLGPAAPIETAVYSCLAAMHLSGNAELSREWRERCMPGDEATLGVRLRECIFDAVAAHLPATVRRLRIAPDGAIAAVAFGALPWRNGRLIDAFEISLVSCGRALLAARAPAVSAGPALILANPDYDLGPLPTPVDPASPPDFWFAPLPHSASEAIKAQGRIGGDVHSGEQASRSTLLAAASPVVLHLATHGFYLPVVARGTNLIGNWRKEGFGLEFRGDVLSLIMEDPLLRAGLACAGVNAYSAGTDLQGSCGDGLVTAHDVSRMNLQGTRLVFLSACSTARGAVRPGEGSAGLLQSFEAAGARSVVATLWATADHPATVNLIDRFYARYTAGETVPAALRNAQLELKQLGVPTWVWASYAAYGDPRATWEAP